METLELGDKTFLQLEQFCQPSDDPNTDKHATSTDSTIMIPVENIRKIRKYKMQELEGFGRYKTFKCWIKVEAEWDNGPEHFWTFTEVNI